MTVRRPKSRLILSAAMLLLSVSAMPGLALAQEAAPAAPGVRATKIPAATVVSSARREMTDRVPINGSLVARETVNVMPQVTGYQIDDVTVDVGDSVAKGQVLVRLDRKPLESQLKQAEAEIAAAEATIAQNKSRIDGDAATLKQAELVLERARKLVKSGAGAQSTLDDAEAQFTSATATLQVARDTVATSEATLEQQKARRDELALQLSRTDVVAPVSGIVATRNANIGQSAGMDTTSMFTIIRNGEIEFDGQIIETAVGDVKPGQTVTLRLSGFPERAGRVRLVSPNVDPKTRLGSVKIAMDDDAGLPIGIFASAVVTVAFRDAVAVPLSAVVPSEAGNTVQVVGDDGVIDVRKVETGIVEGDYVEISEGLGAGETVVAKSGPFFRKGMKIRPVPAQTTPAETAPAPSPPEEAELARGRSSAGGGKAVAR